MEVYEILERALEKTEAGWCQFALEDGNGGVCALGALNWAEHGTPEAGDITEAGVDAGRLAVSCIEGGDGMHFALMDFNNSPGRTQTEVCDLFKRAIAKAKADAGIYLEVPAKERVEA